MSVWLQTHSGLALDVLDPQPEQICIDDIATALSRICRFGGHTKFFYSVAQHSLLCYQNLRHLPFVDQLGALLHDASEAYLCDVPRPVKHLMPEYKRVEDRLSQVIAQKFGANYPWHLEIHQMDLRLLHTEKRDLLTESPRPWVTDAEPLRNRVEQRDEDEVWQWFVDVFESLQRLLENKQLVLDSYGKDVADDYERRCVADDTWGYANALAAAGIPYKALRHGK